MHERPGDRDALLQTAAQRADASLRALENPHLAQRTLRRAPHVDHAVQSRRELDVLTDGKSVVQHALMRDETNLRARRGIPAQ